MALVIPFVPSIANYKFTVPIEGATYVFDVKWNARAGEREEDGTPAVGAWYFDVLDVNEVAIAKGIKIVLGAYLGRRTSHPLFDDGVFVALDTTGDDREAVYDDLGERVIVYYFLNDEALATVIAMLTDESE